jgi:hypothetical protein
LAERNVVVREFQVGHEDAALPEEAKKVAKDRICLIAVRMNIGPDPSRVGHGHRVGLRGVVHLDVGRKNNYLTPVPAESIVIGRWQGTT